jgi:Protein of unknown function (DUF 659)
LLEECTKYHEILSVDKPKTQSTLHQHFPPISTARKAVLDKKFALAVYTTSRAFTAFEDPTWLDFFKELGYKPPTASALARPLLDQVHTKVKAQVDTIRKGSALGLVMDESIDISLNRLVNYLFLTPDGSSFYWKTVDAKTTSQSAAQIAEDAIEVANEISSGDLSKFVSIATDTCPTNQKVWKLLSNNPKTKHIFMVLCDSHSLQLLIKDLLKKISSINRV